MSEPPKKPLTAFFLYLGETKPSVISKEPNLKATEVVSVVSEKWSNLKDADKEKYKKRAADYREKYPKLLEKWRKANPEAAREMDEKEQAKANRKAQRKNPKGKKAKDPNAPKKGRSAYIFYGNAMRVQKKSEYAALAPAQVMSAIGESWKGLSDEDKSVYQKMAEQDKLRYEREMEVYQQQ